MKKLLGIIVLGLLLSGNAYAAGECIKGNCSNGYGTLSFDTATLEGNFKDGKFHGVFRLFNKTQGRTYVLNLENGKATEFLIDEKSIKIDKSITSKKTLKIDVYAFILDVADKPNNNFVEQQIETSNRVWKQANIFWNLKSIELIKPGMTWNKYQSYYEKNCKPLKSCFYNLSKSKAEKIYKRIDKLVNIKKNKKNDGVNIFFLPDNIPWRNVANAMVRENPKKQFQTENEKYILLPYLRVYDGYLIENKSTLPHELGHILNLTHVKKDFVNGVDNNSKRLMYSGTSGAYLEMYEINNSRESAKTIFKIK